MYFPVTIETDWLALFITGLISISGTILGIYCGVRWALTSFYSQKWWEKQYDVFSSFLILLGGLRTTISSLGDHCTIYSSTETDNVDEELAKAYAKKLDETYSYLSSLDMKLYNFDFHLDYSSQKNIYDLLKNIEFCLNWFESELNKETMRFKLYGFSDEIAIIQSIIRREMHQKLKVKKKFINESARLQSEKEGV